jgi:hypothetical protein
MRDASAKPNLVHSILSMTTAHHLQQTLEPKEGKKEAARIFRQAFPPSLTLLYVKRLPTLVHNISVSVHNATIAFSDNRIQLPPSEAGLMIAETRDLVELNLKSNGCKPVSADEGRMVQFTNLQDD